METEGLTGKLSAILSIDSVGCSRLMRDDDETTVETLTSYHSILSPLIEQYRRTVWISPGDNMPTEFTSAVDAVNCGAEIQREPAAWTAELPKKREGCTSASEAI